MLKAGARDAACLTVGESDSATAAGTGDVPVIAARRLLTLCESAACA